MKENYVEAVFRFSVIVLITFTIHISKWYQSLSSPCFSPFCFLMAFLIVSGIVWAFLPIYPFSQTHSNKKEDLKYSHKNLLKTLNKFAKKENK